MRISVNASCGDLRTPESILIDKQRARFRAEVLDQALAAITSDYVRLVIHARYQLGWTFETIAAEFRVEPSTVWRAHNQGLAIIRLRLAARGVRTLQDIL